MLVPWTERVKNHLEHCTSSNGVKGEISDCADYCPMCAFQTEFVGRTMEQPCTTLIQGVEKLSGHLIMILTLEISATEGKQFASPRKTQSQERNSLDMPTAVRWTIVDIFGQRTLGEQKWYVDCFPTIFWCFFGFSTFYMRLVISQTCTDPKTGELKDIIRLPTDNVTSVAFGGEELKDLYISTAIKNNLEVDDDGKEGRIYVRKNTGQGKKSTYFRL